MVFYKITKALAFPLGLLMKDGTFLLSQFVSKLVPSTIKSLTSVFGMGTGGPLLHQHRHGITASQLAWNYLIKLVNVLSHIDNCIDYNSDFKFCQVLS